MPLHIAQVNRAGLNPDNCNVIKVTGSFVVVGMLIINDHITTLLIKLKASIQFITDRKANLFEPG